MPSLIIGCYEKNRKRKDRCQVCRQVCVHSHLHLSRLVYAKDRARGRFVLSTPGKRSPPWGHLGSRCQLCPQSHCYQMDYADSPKRFYFSLNTNYRAKAKWKIGRGEEGFTRFTSCVQIKGCCIWHHLRVLMALDNIDVTFYVQQYN